MTRLAALGGAVALSGALAAPAGAVSRAPYPAPYPTILGNYGPSSYDPAAVAAALAGGPG